MPVRGLNEKIRALTERLSDLSPIMEEIGEGMHSSIQRNFAVGGRFGNDNVFGGGTQQWIPSQRAIAEGGQTLKKTTSSGLAGSVDYRVEGNTIVIGTNKVYGAIHHFGGETGRNHAVTLPARPWMVLQNEDLEDIEATITDYYSRLL